MSGSTAPICEKCEVSKNNQFEVETSNVVAKDPALAHCHGSYTAVSVCMKNNKGSIAECRQEWDEFRSCHRQAKTRNKS